ncbi:hypothetical protein BC830DRAFT_795827 [Chytriomyces sp. MP71]|nr:hypothetical protein BC830DRAFT_795827 [Chytriomyces sp. MP71]
MHEPFAEMLRIVHRSGGFVTLHADVLGPASFAAALRLVPGNMRVAVHIKRGDPVPLLSVLAEATWLNQHDLFLDSSELPEMQEIPLLPNTRCLRVSKLVNFGAHLARKMPNLQVLIHRHMDEDTRTFATDQLSNLLSYQRVYRSAIESICLSAPQLRCIRLEMSDHANARLMLATQWRIVTHTLGWKMKRIMGVNITDSHELVVLRLTLTNVHDNRNCGDFSVKNSRTAITGNHKIGPTIRRKILHLFV